MQIQDFFDERTSTLSYVVWDEETRDAIVIDPVLDYDPVGSKVWQESVAKLVDFLHIKQLHLHLILETHAHADHLSGSQALKSHMPNARVGISERIRQVQKVFRPVFESALAVDGSQFDVLVSDRETLHAGSLEILALPTPGHTPACTSFVIGDAVFTGDAIFLPDVGTGRCDFPEGSATKLFHSVRDTLYSLPDSTRIFVGHDYPPDDREPACESTVAEEKASNTQLSEHTEEADYLAFRDKRDSSLPAPRLLYQSIQVNIDAGHLPKSKAGKPMLKIPINLDSSSSVGTL